MIPKKIHYCWFGGNPLPEMAQKCIASWKKYCPDYCITRWDESNYDFSSAPLYVQQAYEARQWAFVTDYIRLQVVLEQGGIYMDTDVELIQSIDHLLGHNSFFGFETPQCIATGLGFGAVPGASILKEMMDDYHGVPFVLADGSFDRTPCPQRNTQAFLRRGLVADGSLQTLDGDILVMPQEYLCPMDSATKLLNITQHTLSIHHYGASWLTPEEHLIAEYCSKLYRFLPENLGWYIARAAAAVKMNGLSGLVSLVAKFITKKNN